MVCFERRKVLTVFSTDNTVSDHVMLMTNKGAPGFGSGPFTIVLAVDHWVFGVSMWGEGGSVQ